MTVDVRVVQAVHRQLLRTNQDGTDTGYSWVGDPRQQDDGSWEIPLYRNGVVAPVAVVTVRKP